MTEDFVDELVKIIEKNTILITKDAVEYMLLNESKREYFVDLLSQHSECVISTDMLMSTETYLQMEDKNIEKEEKKEVMFSAEVIRPSASFEAKNYDVKIRDIWELNTDFEAKTSVNNFIEYFNDRFRKIKSMLLKRPGVKNVVTIEKAKSNTLREGDITLIGIIREKIISNTGFIRFIIEDETSHITAIPKDEIKKEAESVLEDDVVAFKGRVNSKGNFIISEIMYPDIPMPSSESISKLSYPLTAAFISDLHFGSKLFIKKIYSNFLKWLKSGDELASRLKFIFILGDNVDGIGIYPEQINELELTNIYDQYKAFEEFLLKIPDHIEVVVIPGNHDAVRLAEPQPVLPEKFFSDAYKMSNIHFKTNPSFIGIGDFEKEIKILLYHGYSFNTIIDALPEIRKVAKDKPTIVMRELLKRRHLAPIYGSTFIAPKKIDMHVIDTVPDIFASGDLHSHDVSNYKGVTLISGSTWQDQTAFQDRVGHKANPGKLTVVDLSTREFFVIDLLNTL